MEKNFDNISIKLCHDIDGNVYIKLHNEYHILSINSTNDIEFNKIYNYDIISADEKMKRGNLIKKNDTLKNKIEIDIENEIENEDENNYNDEEEQNYELLNEIKIRKYLTEDKYYEIDKSTDIPHDPNYDPIFDRDDMDNETFTFYGDGSFITYERICIDVPAMYDTFIKDNSNYIVTTIQSSDYNQYRITINHDWTFELNVIGFEIKKYSITLADDKLTILSNLLSSKTIS